MKKILLSFLCLILLGSALAAQSTNGTRARRTAGQTPQSAGGQTDTGVAEDDEVLKIDTTLVTIPVSVFDRTGRFIPGLKKQDFQISEDGKVQQIDLFATTEQPFTVVLLIDVSRSTQFKIEEIQDAAIAFVDQLRPQDRVMVIAFDDEIQILSEPTGDRRELRNAIQRTQFGGGTRLYDAVDFSLNERLNSIEGRKAVVLFTDGVDSSSVDSNYARTVADAERSDVIIYPVRYDTSEYNGGGNTTNFPFPRRRGGGGGNGGGTIQWPFPWPGSGGSGGGNGGGNGGGGNGGGNRRGGGNNRGGRGSQGGDDYALGERYLKELAEKTGGRYFNAATTGNLETAFAGIAEELRQQYSLGYYPEDQGRPGQKKQVSVRVARANVSVKARSYYIVGEQEKNKGKIPPNRLAAR
jgi:Ca-activated chloride channel family protein